MSKYKSYELVGGRPVKIDPLNVEGKGTVFAEEGHAFNPVVCDFAPGPNITSLEVTANGDYAAPQGEAYDQVSVGVPNSYDSEDEGKVVLGGQLVSQGSNTVTTNDTYDTTLINSLTVQVPQGGGSGYDSYETITGTLANPLGTYSFADISSALQGFAYDTGGFARSDYDASAISAGTGFGSVFYDSDNYELWAVGALVDGANSSSSAFTMIWDANGLVSAYMEQNGTITDISPYASLITTTIYIPTIGGGA